MRIIGLDIGSIHNGVAIIDADTAELIKTETCTTERLIANLELLSPEDTLIVGLEQFVLYKWATKSQTWSDFPNVQTIGVARYLLNKAKIPHMMLKAVESKQMYQKTRLKRLGYDIQNDAHDHQKDALSVALLTRDFLQKKSNRIYGLEWLDE